MEVGSDIVGAKLKTFEVEITQRMINNYAAAVGDANPRYLDDSLPCGLIAPPALASAITWPIIANIQDYLDTMFPPEVLFTLVHYTERLHFYRPMVPGDKLTINGEVAAVVPEKSGTHVVFKLPAVDQAGAPVFTEYIGGMLRGVACADGGRSAEDLPTFPATPEGSLPLWEAALPIRREDCYIYEGCTDVIFPIHTSPSFARSVGLPDIIYYGVATLARAVSELVNRELFADPSSITVLACRFRAMVLPNSFIRVQLLSRQKEGDAGQLLFRVLNSEGKEAVANGLLRYEAPMSLHCR